MAKTGLFAGILAVFCLAAAARAGIADFTGNWENAGRDASGIAHVVISPAGGDHVSVRVYGTCHPVECNWGLVEGKSYTADPRSSDVERIRAVFNTGFSRKEIIFRKGDSGELTFEVLTEFVDGSERHDFDMTGRLRPSALAGPVGDNWNRPASQGTGWGGGAHSGFSPRPAETCQPFDNTAVHVVHSDDSWQVAAGSQRLVEPSRDERTAIRALETIRHFGFDRTCRTGTSPMVYWKRGAEIPNGHMGGADCITFNPTTVHLAHMGHVWKIVDGVQWIADFGPDKVGADEALSLIRFYSLDRECFVGGRQGPVMVYWLAH